MIYEWLSTLLGKIGLGILLATLFVLYLSLFVDIKSIFDGLRKVEEMKMTPSGIIWAKRNHLK